MVIAVSEIAAAVASSVFVAATLMLLAYLLTRCARRAGALLPDDPIERTVEHGAAIGRELVGREPDHNGERSWLDQRLAVAIGSCLVASTGLRLVGTFVPLYRAVPHATPSFTLYSTLHYAAIVWYVEIALTVAIGWLAIRRRDRVIAAIVVGYCAPAIGGVALYATFFTFPQTRLGPAYYLLLIADSLEVVALVIAVIAIVVRNSDRARPRVQSVRLGVLAAALLAVSAPMNLTRLQGMSLWSFGLFPSRTVPAIVVNLAVLALVPLIAIRLGGSTASFIVLGLAVTTALSVADAELSRLGVRVRFDLTVGFWLTAVGSAVLLVLVGSLRRDDRFTQDAPVPTTIS
jgi:hypothetical protein